MARLSHVQRMFLVNCLARSLYPKAIREEFKEEFGAEVWNSQITYFKHAPKYRLLIEEQREVHNKLLMDERIAQPREQLRMLQNAYDIAEEGTHTVKTGKDGTTTETFAKNPAAMVAAVSKANEIVYGRKTTMELTGKDGKPIEHEHRFTFFPPEPKTMDEWQEQMKEIRKQEMKLITGGKKDT